MRLRIDVTCTYSVNITTEVPDEVAKVLLECGTVEEEGEANEWLCSNIREGDAYDWEFDITDAEEIQEKGNAQ